MLKYLPTLISLFFLSQMNYAQISFTESNDLLNGNFTFSGAPITVHDVNGDRLDDIVALDQVNNIKVFIQTPGANFSLQDYGVLAGFNWGMAVADLDHDGWSDVVTGGAYDQIKFSRLQADGSLLNDILVGPPIFVQGVSFSDIDNDGFLDAFLCHDDGSSSIYMNDGQGGLSFDTSYPINRNFGSQESNAGNYGCVWTDIDSDGDTDLYLAKCRQGVNDRADVRRINQLWLNDGAGNYTEAAADFQLDIGWQSWTAEFQDIDNDGDFDAFITNHDTLSLLYENINNTTFVDITENSGIDYQGWPIQASMKDFDNDGFVDLIISGPNARIYRNNGDRSFTPILDYDLLNSFAIGDLNSDGFLDLYAGFGIGFNNPSAENEDVLLLNDGNDNNYLTVSLNGIQSNADAIGARLELYGQWGVQVREVRSGESYGICHTAQQTFGLGQATTIDRLVVKWPSGLEETFEDLLPNQTVGIIEGRCISPASSIISDGPLTFCSGEEVNLCAEEGFTYAWNTGENSRCINVTTSGAYWVTVSDGSDCFTVSTITQVEVDPEESFSIFTEAETTFCEGSPVLLQADYDGNITWSNGATGQQIFVNAPGIYSAMADGVCTTIDSENSIQLNMLDAPDSPTVADVTIEENNSVLLEASGDMPQWFDAEFGGNRIGTGNTFTTPVLTETTTYYVDDFMEHVLPSVFLGEMEPQGNVLYHGDNFNAFTIFEVFTPITLETVDVFTDFPGLRRFILTDIDGNVLEQKDIFIEEQGKTVLELNWDLDPANGPYQIGTDPSINNQTFGINSSRLMRTSTDAAGVEINFPYEVDEIISIFDTSFGTAFYYYFYNWQVGGIKETCFSPRSPLTVTVEEPNATFNISDVDFVEVFPNPSSGLINIAIHNNKPYDIQIKSLDGKTLQQYQGVDDQLSVDLKHFPAGMFLVEFKGSDEILQGKIIKQ